MKAIVIRAYGAPGDLALADIPTPALGEQDVLVRVHAEYARAPEDALTPMPAGLGFVQAAAMPRSAVIAQQGIVDHGQLRAGQRVLVNAGGGVGTFAVQLAKLRGAEVTAVDSGQRMSARASASLISKATRSSSSSMALYAW